MSFYINFIHTRKKFRSLSNFSLILTYATIWREPWLWKSVAVIYYKYYSDHWREPRSINNTTVGLLLRPLESKQTLKTNSKLAIFFLAILVTQNSVSFNENCNFRLYWDTNLFLFQKIILFILFYLCTNFLVYPIHTYS